ncbi:hypothetical protein M3M33_08835 [Loigolactobacillus coryniformis]|uniref:hypothetical protein n=1 Tax=Loigolactobacillus coryniformis TaxID=1610 RepID=UPI00201A718A|nr:hypothetical protein [Loigolactobacillus coryniformis]MCL5458757.1 hypothetical protein [Loigolactobacillus coryniformis]
MKFFTAHTTTASKIVTLLYALYRLIVIVMLGSSLYRQQWSHVALLVLTLILFTLPYIIETYLHINIPSLLELIVISFIFSSTILGELSDFYGYIPIWDTALHTLNGFLAAGVGFSLIYLLNENTTILKLTPLFIAVTTFCFSMTVGVAWEFVEFSADRWLNMDMQKDRIVRRVNSVDLGSRDNTVVQLQDIQRTVIDSKTADGKKITTVINNGYLDVGVVDTMKDLFVNFIGALFFSIFGYLYIEHEHKRFHFIRNFIPTRRKF